MDPELLLPLSGDGVGGAAPNFKNAEYTCHKPFMRSPSEYLNKIAVAAREGAIVGPITNKSSFHGELFWTNTTVHPRTNQLNECLEMHSEFKKQVTYLWVRCKPSGRFVLFQGRCKIPDKLLQAE
jgi:hypothetical protein